MVKSRSKNFVTKSLEQVTEAEGYLLFGPYEYEVQKENV